MRFLDVTVSECFRFFIHIEANVVHQLSDRLLDIFKRNGKLLAVIATNSRSNAVFDIARTEFKTEGNALHLVLVEFPAGRLFGEIAFRTDTSLYEAVDQRFRGVYNAVLVHCDGNDDNLNGCDGRR